MDKDHISDSSLDDYLPKDKDYCSQEIQKQRDILKNVNKYIKEGQQMQALIVQKQKELKQKKEMCTNLRKFIGKRMFSELSSDSSDEEEQFRRLRFQAYKKYI